MKINFSLLYKKCLPLIIRYVLQNNGTLDDAKDILQDAMVLVWRKIQQDEVQNTEQLYVYIFRVAKNLWRDKLKKYSGLIVDYQTNDVYNQAWLKEYGIEGIGFRHKIIKVFYEDFKNTTCKTMMILKYLQGKNYDEISVEMCYTIETVRSKLYKCRKRFKKLLKEKEMY